MWTEAREVHKGSFLRKPPECVPQHVQTLLFLFHSPHHHVGPASLIPCVIRTHSNGGGGALWTENTMFLKGSFTQTFCKHSPPSSSCLATFLHPLLYDPGFVCQCQRISVSLWITYGVRFQNNPQTKINKWLSEFRWNFLESQEDKLWSSCEVQWKSLKSLSPGTVYFVL